MKKWMCMLILSMSATMAWAQEKFDSAKFYSGEELLTKVCKEYKNLTSYPYLSIETYTHFQKFYASPCHDYFFPRSGLEANNGSEKSYLQKDMMKAIGRYCITANMKKLRENYVALNCVKGFDKKYFSPEAVKQCEDRETSLKECMSLSKNFSHLEVEEKAINNMSRSLNTKQAPLDSTSQEQKKGFKK